MNRFLFTRTNADGSTSIYSTDGTAAGAVDLGVNRFGYSAPASGPDLASFGGKAAFLGDSNQVPGVFLTDGTAAGTSFSAVAAGSLVPSSLDVANGQLLASFGGSHDELWSSSNGSAFAQISAQIEVAPGGIVQSGSLGYFNAQQIDAAGNQVSAGVYRTDGTAAGTYQVGAASSDIVSLGNGKAVYTSANGTGTDSLYVTSGGRSDGTKIVNTNLGATFLPGTGGASTGTRAVFGAIGTDGNVGIWSTDGTAAGTVEVSFNGPANAAVRTPGAYVQLGNKVLFDSGYSVIETDGTKAGTTLLQSGPTDGGIFVAGGKGFYFDEYANGVAISVTDGTAAGTKTLAVPGLSSVATAIRAVDNGIVFSGTDTAGNAALFASDGTAAGTGEIALPAGVTAASITAVGSLPAAVALGNGSVSYKATAGQSIIAGAGSDTITASSGGVTVTGGSGHLSFFGGGAASSVSGGAGSSTILTGSGGGHFAGGSAGGNILVSQGAASGNTTLTGGGAGDQIFGSAGGNDMLVAGAGREAILGGGGPTTVQGGSTADVIFTGAGVTQVYGGTGAADTIVGGSGAVTVTANAGDAIFGNSGHLSVTGSHTAADSIIGGAGGLAVNGIGGNMLVVAGSGASSIATGSGASLIFEGAGTSTVVGGVGSMEVVLGSGSASITNGSGSTAFEVVKGAAGGTDMLSGFKVGTDTISLFGYSAADTNVSVGGNNTLISLADGTKITVVGVTNLGSSLLG